MNKRTISDSTMKPSINVKQLKNTGQLMVKVSNALNQELKTQRQMHRSFLWSLTYLNHKLSSGPSPFRFVLWASRFHCLSVLFLRPSYKREFPVRVVGYRISLMSLSCLSSRIGLMRFALGVKTLLRSYDACPGQLPRCWLCVLSNAACPRPFLLATL